MILLDPDLAPSASADSPRTTMAVRTGASGSQTALHRDGLPSTRTLSRFLNEAITATRLRGHVSVLLTTDAAIRRLNRRFRGKNKSTDVLSFPAGGPASDELAGDLALSVPAALRQAREQGHPLLSEIKVLILHGLLHLAGYDHETDDGQMLRRERLLRGRLKLPQGLIERTSAPGKPLAVRSSTTPRSLKAVPRQPGVKGRRP